MSQKSWILMIGRETARLAHGVAPDYAISESMTIEWDQPSTAAEQILPALRELGYAGEPLLLVLEAELCLTVATQLSSPRQARNRSSMGYLMEERLPFAAEDCVVDYECDGHQAFMMAVERWPLAAIVQELVADVVHVHSITSLDRLALAGVLSLQSQLPSEFILISRAATGLNLWRLQRQRPREWRHLPLSHESIVENLAQTTVAAPVCPIFCAGVSEELFQQIQDWSPQPLPAPCDEVSYLNAAFRQASRVLSGQEAAPVEFRRDGLAGRHSDQRLRRRKRALFASAVLLMLILAASTTIHAKREGQRLLVAGDMERSLYARVYPGAAVPVSARSRLQSELARLRGLHSAQKKAPAPHDALAVILQLLKALPTDYRFQIAELRIDDGQLYLVGRVRNHGDADRFAEAIRQAGLNAAAPTTHQLQADGVEYRVAARLPDSTLSRTVKTR